MTEVDLLEQQSRGQTALHLLENELLKEALEAIEKEVMEQWIACPARDKEGKEALWQLIKTSRKFREILLGYINTGKLATANLKRFEEESRLRRLFPR
jgi:hypothetical protein